MMHLFRLHRDASSIREQRMIGFSATSGGEGPHPNMPPESAYIPDTELTDEQFEQAMDVEALVAQRNADAHRVQERGYQIKKALSAQERETYRSEVEADVQAAMEHGESNEEINDRLRRWNDQTLHPLRLHGDIIRQGGNVYVNVTDMPEYSAHDRSPAEQQLWDRLFRLRDELRTFAPGRYPSKDAKRMEIAQVREEYMAARHARMNGYEYNPREYARQRNANRKERGGNAVRREAQEWTKAEEANIIKSASGLVLKWQKAKTVEDRNVIEGMLLMQGIDVDASDMEKGELIVVPKEGRGLALFIGLIRMAMGLIDRAQKKRTPIEQKGEGGETPIENRKDPKDMTRKERDAEITSNKERIGVLNKTKESKNKEIETIEKQRKLLKSDDVAGKDKLDADEKVLKNDIKEIEKKIAELQARTDQLEAFNKAAHEAFEKMSKDERMKAVREKNEQFKKSVADSLNEVFKEAESIIDTYNLQPEDAAAHKERLRKIKDGVIGAANSIEPDFNADASKVRFLIPNTILTKLEDNPDLKRVSEFMKKYFKEALPGNLTATEFESAEDAINDPVTIGEDVIEGFKSAIKEIKPEKKTPDEDAEKVTSAEIAASLNTALGSKYPITATDAGGTLLLSFTENSASYSEKVGLLLALNNGATGLNFTRNTSAHTLAVTPGDSFDKTRAEALLRVMTEGMPSIHDAVRKEVEDAAKKPIEGKPGEGKPDEVKPGEEKPKEPSDAEKRAESNKESSAVVDNFTDAVEDIKKGADLKSKPDAEFEDAVNNAIAKLDEAFKHAEDSIDPTADPYFKKNLKTQHGSEVADLTYQKYLNNKTPENRSAALDAFNQLSQSTDDEMAYIQQDLENNAVEDATERLAQLREGGKLVNELFEKIRGEGTPISETLVKNSTQTVADARKKETAHRAEMQNETDKDARFNLSLKYLAELEDMKTSLDKLPNLELEPPYTNQERKTINENNENFDKIYKAATASFADSYNADWETDGKTNIARVESLPNLAKSDEFMLNPPLRDPVGETAWKKQAVDYLVRTLGLTEKEKTEFFSTTAVRTETTPLDAVTVYTDGTRGESSARLKIDRKTKDVTLVMTGRFAAKIDAARSQKEGRSFDEDSEANDEKVREGNEKEQIRRNVLESLATKVKIRDIKVRGDSAKFTFFKKAGEIAMDVDLKADKPITIKAIKYDRYEDGDLDLPGLGAKDLSVDEAAQYLASKLEPLGEIRH